MFQQILRFLLVFVLVAPGSGSFGLSFGSRCLDSRKTSSKTFCADAKSFCLSCKSERLWHFPMVTGKAEVLPSNSRLPGNRFLSLWGSVQSYELFDSQSPLCSLPTEATTAKLASCSHVFWAIYHVHCLHFISNMLKNLIVRFCCGSANVDSATGGKICGRTSLNVFPWQICHRASVNLLRRKKR